jgi:ornithine carbamoyltransferase
VRHFLEVTDLSAEELTAVLELAERFDLPPVLTGRGVALLFERQSVRTRSSVELAVVQLGGHPQTMLASEVGIDERETAEDLARALGCYHAVLGVRTLAHSTLERMASVNAVPVINLLSDRHHPLQSLGDLLTMRQLLGGLEGKQLAYVGDFNNVARSLTLAAALSGMHVTFGCPEGYGPGDDHLERLHALGAKDVFSTADPVQAVRDVDAVYTDVWVSVGDEASTAQRQLDFVDFTVNERLLAAAAPGAVFLHCLPARRGEEVAATVIDGAASRVWELAANRLPTARALLSWLVSQPAETTPASSVPSMFIDSDLTVNVH